MRRGPALGASLPVGLPAPANRDRVACVPTELVASFMSEPDPWGAAVAYLNQLRIQSLMSAQMNGMGGGGMGCGGGMGGCGGGMMGMGGGMGGCGMGAMGGMGGAMGGCMGGGMGCGGCGMVGGSGGGAGGPRRSSSS